MTQPSLVTYRHTQKGPWKPLCHLIAAAFLAASCFMPVLAMKVVYVVTGVFLILLGASLGHLTVADEGDRLAVRFGPFPLFRRRILYDDIREVTKGRTSFLDGWGIHWSPWSGWLWNIWGSDCAVIRLKRGTVRIGTDDPDGLVQFLTSRTSLSE